MNWRPIWHVASLPIWRKALLDSPCGDVPPHADAQAEKGSSGFGLHALTPRPQRRGTQRSGKTLRLNDGESHPAFFCMALEIEEVMPYTPELKTLSRSSELLKAIALQNANRSNVFRP